MSAKKYLEKAKNSLPQSFKAREVVFHINQAINKLTALETKPPVRPMPQTWYDMLKNGVQNPYTPQRTVEIINRMIADEKNKMQTTLGDEEPETINE